MRDRNIFLFNFKFQCCCVTIFFNSPKFPEMSYLSTPPKVQQIWYFSRSKQPLLIAHLFWYMLRLRRLCSLKRNCNISNGFTQPSDTSNFFATARFEPTPAKIIRFVWSHALYPLGHAGFSYKNSAFSAI